ncbi:MAG: RNA pseudouridine synthase, partial [Mycoplasma sp.]|nr:RNA pseudouridine synthase [Mycoplasma sp.]
NPSFKPTHIHRIDKKCSGIVVYAKTLMAAQQLKEKINKQIKIYVFKSKLNKDIDLKIKLSHNEKKQKIVTSKFGKLCHTKFYLKNNTKYAQIFTGFKHQIRASLASLGCPIIGDSKYGGEKAYRLFLHSYQFTFQELDNDLQYLNNKTFIAPISWKQG